MWGKLRIRKASFDFVHTLELLLLCVKNAFGLHFVAVINKKYHAVVNLKSCTTPNKGDIVAIGFNLNLIAVLKS